MRTLECWATEIYADSRVVYSSSRAASSPLILRIPGRTNGSTATETTWRTKSAASVRIRVEVDLGKYS